MQTKKLGGNLLLIVTAMIWGFAFTAQKVAGDLIPAFALNAIRFLLGALALIPAIFLFDRVRKSGRKFCSTRNPHFFDLTGREFLGGIACGAALLAATICQQFGLLTASAGKASFLTALYMVFVPIFGLLRRKIASFNVWISVVIALGGAYLLTGGNGGGFSLTWGDVMLLLSAALFGLHITLIDIFSPGTDGMRLSFVQFLTAGVLAVPGALVQGIFLGGVGFAWADLLSALPHLLYLGIFSSGVGYTSQVLGQQLSGTPTVASLIMSMESVFGLLGGVIFLGETMEGYQIAGCAIILFAVVFSQLPLDVWLSRVLRKPQKAREPSDPTPPTDTPPTDTPPTV